MSILVKREKVNYEELFIDFLNNKGLLSTFKKALSDDNDKTLDEHMSRCNPYIFMSTAFTWSAYGGFEYWYDINKLWLNEYISTLLEVNSVKDGFITFLKKEGAYDDYLLLLDNYDNIDSIVIKYKPCDLIGIIDWNDDYDYWEKINYNWRKLLKV